MSEVPRYRRWWTDWYFFAEQPAPAPHLANPGECAALRIVLASVPCVSRSCEHFPDDSIFTSYHQVAELVAALREEKERGESLWVGISQ